MASQQTLGSSYIVNSLKSSCWRFWTKIEFFSLFFSWWRVVYLANLVRLFTPVWQGCPKTNSDLWQSCSHKWGCPMFWFACSKEALLKWMPRWVDEIFYLVPNSNIEFVRQILSSCTTCKFFVKSNWDNHFWSYALVCHFKRNFVQLNAQLIWRKKVHIN